MRDWLTIELVLAVLLVTSFTCIGLVALWAATSPRHWFVRTAVVAAVCSPFLLVPVDELFIGALLAIALVCLAREIHHNYWRRKNLARPEKSIASLLPRRFSLASTLLAVSVLAVLVAVAARISISSWQSWMLLMIGGVMAGTATYSASLACDQSLKFRQRVSCVLVMAQMLFFGLTMLGLLFIAFMDVWSSTWSASTPSRVGFWGGAAVIAGALLCISIILLHRATTLGRVAPNSTAVSQPSTKMRIMFAGFLIIVAAPPLLSLWELLHPLPLLADPIPTPNGHERLVELGMRLENSAAVREYMADPIDYGKLAVAVAQQSSDYDEIREAIAMPGWIPVQYDVDLMFADMNQLTAPRQILRALAARCKVALRSGDMDVVTSTYFDVLQLAQALHRGGVAINFLSATACEMTAHGELYDALSKLDRSNCAVLRRQIATYDARRRGIDAVLYRERTWMQRAQGWLGHLAELLGRFAPSGESYWEMREEVQNAHRRSQAIARLLLIELAVREHQLERGTLPSDLNAIVPTYIAEIPVDPFDPAQRPLQYVPTDDGYLLYSVGTDGDDDGGRPPEYNQYGWYSWGGNGDLLLRAYFAPVEENGGLSADVEDNGTDRSTE